MKQLRNRSREPSNGFTLVETLIVISIMAIMALVLGASITAFVKNEGSVSYRITRTRDLQNATNFFPADVASASRVESNATGVLADQLSNPANACGTGGTVLFHFEWTELWDGLYTNRVTYRELPATATEPDRVVRFECENGDPAAQFVIARTYSSVAARLERDGGILTGTVELEITYPDGEVKRITATSRHFLP